MIELTQQEINLLILMIVFFIMFYIGCKLINKRELNIEYKKGSLGHDGEPFIVESNKDDFIRKVEHFKF